MLMRSRTSSERPEQVMPNASNVKPVRRRLLENGGNPVMAKSINSGEASKHVAPKTGEVDSV